MQTSNLHLLQQPPFRFVDSLSNWTDLGAETQFHIEKDIYFVSNNQMQIAGIMENMAQSCAAWMGQLAAEKGESVHFMPLCAISKFKLMRFPLVGEVLLTKVRQIDCDFGIVLMQAHTYVGIEQIAAAEIKVGE